ncbi:MAG: hypothetical protein GTO02_22365 [Candidatus Dadabacteria bacterium]|nr:hypothetical protein [Candidatus Dadabacteria bacterium]
MIDKEKVGIELIELGFVYHRVNPKTKKLDEIIYEIEQSIRKTRVEREPREYARK